jgi:fructuronate reductase
MAETLSALGRAAGDDPASTAQAFLALETVFPRALAADPTFRGAVIAAYAKLAEGRIDEVLAL